PQSTRPTVLPVTPNGGRPPRQSSCRCFSPATASSIKYSSGVDGTSGRGGNFSSITIEPATLTAQTCEPGPSGVSSLRIRTNSSGARKWFATSCATNTPPKTIPNTTTSSRLRKNSNSDARARPPLRRSGKGFVLFAVASSGDASDLLGVTELLINGRFAG